MWAMYSPFGDIAAAVALPIVVSFVILIDWKGIGLLVKYLYVATAIPEAVNPTASAATIMFRLDHLVFEARSSLSWIDRLRPSDGKIAVWLVVSTCVRVETLSRASVEDKLAVAVSSPDAGPSRSALPSSRQ